MLCIANLIMLPQLFLNARMMSRFFEKSDRFDSRCNLHNKNKIQSTTIKESMPRFPSAFSFSNSKRSFSRSNPNQEGKKLHVYRIKLIDCNNYSLPTIYQDNYANNIPSRCRDTKSGYFLYSGLDTMRNVRIQLNNNQREYSSIILAPWIIIDQVIF